MLIRKIPDLNLLKPDDEAQFIQTGMFSVSMRMTLPSKVVALIRILG